MGQQVKIAAPPRGLLAGALLSLLLGMVLAHALVGTSWPSFAASGGTRPSAATVGALQSLDAAAQGPVSAALGAASQAYWLGASSGGVGAPGASARGANPAQGLRESFDSAGLTLSTGALRAGLRLQSARFGSSSLALAHVPPRVARNRALYLRGGLDEWYVNGPVGLEQGFTVAHAPSGRGRGTLTLELALSGNARAALAPGGGSIALTAARSALRYGALAASDAGGRRLHSSLGLSGRTIVLKVDTAGARFPIRIDPLIEQSAKLVAAEESQEGSFGYQVAVSADGDSALVGAPDYDGNRGAAWVFTRSGETWVQQGEMLSGEEERRAARFGYSVALSGDGHTALIGGPRDRGFRGAAWVFTLSGSTWTQQAKLTGESEEVGGGGFGDGVALSEDGNTALVGGSADDSNSGAAWVFTRTGTSWAQQGPKLTGGSEESGEGFLGHSVALSADGNTALIGASGDAGFHGAAWVFAREGATWTQQGEKLTGGSEERGLARFGYSVALAGDGTTALIGGRDDNGLGAAWVFTHSPSGWVQKGTKLIAREEQGHGEFGYSVALSGEGNTALIGAPRDANHIGAAWVFTLKGLIWSQQGKKLTGTEQSGTARFGEDVALSADGQTGLIGGPYDSSKLGAVWTLLGPPPPPPPPPVVTRVTPGEGPAAGDGAVTITGSGFLSGATVTIGSAATSVEVISESEIKARTSATSPGAYEVVVEDADGASTGGPLYTYLATPVTPVGGEPGAEPNLQNTNTTGNGGGSGNTPTGKLGVLGLLGAKLPPPQLGVSGNLAPISGRVLVKLPGSSTFVLLSAAMQVPFGTIVDATDGEVSVTTVGPHGRLQTMDFYGGKFKLIQRRNGMVVAVLIGGNFRVCPTARERSHIASASSTHASGKHVVRKLWSNGHGSYETQGNYASGAVLGTRWLTEDRCDGTYFFVATDKVEVTNFVNHRHRIVHAGHHYLAKSP